MAIDNASGTPELDWMREGLADMLVAGLSRSDKLTLIDRGHLAELGDGGRQNSSERSSEIARGAHADLFVTGTFAQVGERLRLDIHVRDGESGAVLNTESLTVEKAEEILSDIDLLSLRIASRLSGGTPFGDQRLETVMTNDLEAYRNYSLGVEKARAFESKAALEYFQKATELDPEFAMAQARIGYTYVMSWGQADNAKPYLEKAFRQSARLTERDRMNITAWYAVANRDYEGGIAAYREVINRSPLDTEAYWRLSRLLAGEERNDEAIDVLRRGIAVDPQSKVLYNGLGSLLSDQARHAEAIAAHERYVALAPNEPNSYDSLGLTLQGAGDYDGAIQSFERALSLRPSFDVALIHMANARIRFGQYRSAVDLLHQYIASAPSNGEASRGFETLAYIDLRRGDVVSARKHAAESVRLNPENVWMNYLLSVQMGQAGKGAEFEAQIRNRSSAIGRGSRLSTRLDGYLKGVFALNGGRPDEAMAYFGEALRHPPLGWNYADLEDCLGTAFLTEGRYDDAIVEFRRILAASPHYPLAQYYLARAFEGKGMADDARNTYLAFLEDWKNADQDIPELVEARKHIAL